MPRISEIEADSLPDDAREIFHRYVTDYGPFENQAKIFAQRPPALRHIMGLLMDLADEGVLPKRYLEIALVTVSKLNSCKYCIAHHSPRMTEQGFDASTVEHLLDEHVPGFNEVDQLVRDYTIKVTEDFQYIRDDIFNELKKHFSEAQIFELTLRIALCGFFNRVNDALQISIEEGVLADMQATGATIDDLLPASP